MDQVMGRERLLALVRARVERFNAGQDPAVVLDPEAVAELTALLETVPDPAADIEVAYAAGLLHWFRYLVLEPGHDEQDLRAALTMFLPVYRVRPDAVPAQVRTHFGRVDASADPFAVAQSAFILLREALGTADQGVLDAAIDLFEVAVAAIPGDDPDRAKVLSNLGIALHERFEHERDPADLDAAINLLRQAVAASPDGDPADGMLYNLARALHARFEQARDLADLDAEIDARRRAVAASPAGDQGRAGYLSSLGEALLARFIRVGDRADMDAAVDTLRRAVAATRAGHPDSIARLVNLGGALQERFQRLGDRADLDEAIDLLRRVAVASPADHPDRVMMLSNLGITLKSRFQLAGDRADLDAAIDLFRQAVAASPAGHPGHARYLFTLGSALAARSERLGDRADLDEAIDLLRQAVAASPADHPDRATMLSDLGSALIRQYARTGDPADLDAAVDAGRRAVAASPASDPDRARYLFALGRSLAIRLGQGDLDEAIDLFRQAVAASPAGHPERARYLSGLGAYLGIRFELAGDQADLDAAIDAGQQAVAVEVASPRVRAVAASVWGRAAASGQRWQEAVAGFAEGAELLGLMVPRSLSRRDQEEQLEALGEVGELAADAAACCVHAGLKDRAVELFEQGRGILLSQALDTRTDLTALAGQHPDLAARFTLLRGDLDRAASTSGPLAAPPPGPGGTADAQAEAADGDMERRRAAADAFDQVISEIRRLPGFREFLRPPPLAELLRAASAGPVVVVTVSRFGSYALILADGGVLDPVPLSGLTPETVYYRVVAFLGALDDASSPTAGEDRWAAAEEQLDDTLGWLWDELAGPVLDRLRITGPPRDGQPWPRLWWCVSGLLSFLPVHAAGRHRTQAGVVPATVIDRVISSYTPTVRALTRARQPGAVTGSGESDRPGARDRVVAVAMPRTPGASDLRGAQEEAKGLQQRFRNRVTVLSGLQATYDTVLTALATGRWAHFACHGVSDPSSPSASRLLLTDHQQRPLTVLDVARLRLDDAGLAFLSACSTAQPGRRLPDEAIHLASAFQLAGYRHVIATLWPIGDRQGVELAAGIYSALDPAAVGGGDVAGAVHAAIRRMRQQWKTPSVWASHIHVGA
jgi:tetratricopeptide (TPR) repeat protein